MTPQFDQGLLTRSVGSSVGRPINPIHSRASSTASPEHLRGVRDEAATRELIVRENRQSRAGSDLVQEELTYKWLHAAGEREETSRTSPEP